MNKKFITPMKYINGRLQFDGFDVIELTHKLQTPFYLYSEGAFSSNYEHYQKASRILPCKEVSICYALKANPNQHLLKSIAKQGAGADIVSKGELKCALRAGIKASKIIFSGVGKTQCEIYESLNVSRDGIFSFNVESEDELYCINRVASELNKKARIAFRFNPNVIAKTHKNIQTGGKNHKFGLLEDEIKRLFYQLSQLKNVKFVGLSIHIGSQLIEFSALKKSLKKLIALKNELNSSLEFLDVGGGLGIDYSGENQGPTPYEYMNCIKQGLGDDIKDMKIIFEPGRSICATAGILVTKVIRTKQSDQFHFTVVDAGLNDFMRPSLYHAYHQILPCIKKSSKKIITNIVGPVCETTDLFASNVLLTSTHKDDVMIIKDAGAYGKIMSSNYNLRPQPREFVISKNRVVLS